jgi:hypothetical protein
MERAYEEVIDFIAAGTSPEEVTRFAPSETAQRRAQALVQKEKEETLSDAEAAELDHYMQLEHLMRLAKARARQHLPAGPSQEA